MKRNEFFKIAGMSLLTAPLLLSMTKPKIKHEVGEQHYDNTAKKPDPASEYAMVLSLFENLNVSIEIQAIYAGMYVLVFKNYTELKYSPPFPFKGHNVPRYTTSYCVAKPSTAYFKNERIFKDFAELTSYIINFIDRNPYNKIESRQKKIHSIFLENPTTTRIYLPQA